MSRIAARPWTLEAFFRWQEEQEDRYELVGGFPLKMMTGASNRHDRIVVNVLLGLGNRLRGSPCRPFTADGSIETYSGQVRRPDAGVDCGSFEPESYKATEPRLVVEILSPSTRDFDTFGKIEEYKTVPSIAHILLVEPNAATVLHWHRDEDDLWTRETLEGLDSCVVLSRLDISLPLSEIYEGIDFPEAPRLSL